MWYLEKNNHITHYQSGFAYNTSTTDPIVQLENSIRQKIARKTIKLLYFSTRKAYDTVWRHNIIRKLHKYGLREHLINFLSERQIKVKINNIFSESRNLVEGIP